MTDAGITTIATFGEKKTRLKRSKLPRTFKHFFEIAKLMKIRYVWIDSLCIVQDSDKDRQRELACVGQIYSGAVCTIAAESAKDAQGGIWLESRIRKVEVEGTTTLETISQEQNIRTYLSVIDQRLHKSPLQQRAWSLPERMLSPRVLHFTFSHIYWECREIKLDNPVLLADVEEVVASPAGRQAASSEWHHMTKLRPFDVPVDIRMDPYSTGFLSSLSTSNLFYVWRMLIEDYTTKYLTQWSDRLPALSGLAAETQMHVNSEYICGIWSDDPKGLLWAVDDSVHTSEKVEIGAPSWSWASHERDPITYRHIHEALATEDVETIPLARIMHTHIVPAGLDPKGRASYGSVHIMCRARRITCVEHLHSMRCTFYREDATIRPQFKYSEHNSVMIIRVLASERNGSWGLVLQPSTKYGQVDFVRIGVIGGVENRWFDDGYDRTVSIV
ncbi:heterokaryon incompatibility protein-domain-containing protein [Calycina marina]|uniref:Heterokaryon incompatibility protein-domain-containing protein n=1 Tax=Calycina marina TaxID=1763456 RepID=A0A9P7Z4T6_9HELO|nr:heterokaryon incompatibility protein-domain-containing protein [Calycina marina]